MLRLYSTSAAAYKHYKMSDMIDRPENCKLSTTDSQLLVDWGRTRVYYDEVTEGIRGVFSQYCVNATEFTAMGAEIRYHLQFSLDEESQAVLRKSGDIKGMAKHLRSPEENGIARAREKILGRVYNLFTKLKRELYPELLAKFVEPAREGLDVPIVATPVRRAIIGEAEETVDFAEEEEEIPISPPNLDFSQAVSTPSAPEPLYESRILFDDVITFTKITPILELLNPLMMSLSTTVTTFSDADNFVVEYLARFDIVGKSVTHTIDEDIFDDIIMCIPTTDHALIFSSAITSGRPFILYLPLSVISDMDISTINCNLIITGDFAWFFYHSTNRGGVYEFKLILDI